MISPPHKSLLYTWFVFVVFFNFVFLAASSFKNNNVSNILEKPTCAVKPGRNLMEKSAGFEQTECLSEPVYRWGRLDWLWQGGSSTEGEVTRKLEDLQEEKLSSTQTLVLLNTHFPLCPANWDDLSPRDLDSASRTLKFFFFLNCKSAAWPRYFFFPCYTSVALK